MSPRQFKNLEPNNVLTVLQLRFPSLVWLCDKLGLEISIARSRRVIRSFIEEAVKTDVADKEGNYIERFNAEISPEKHIDSPFSTLNGKMHLTNSLVGLLSSNPLRSESVFVI